MINAYINDVNKPVGLQQKPQIRIFETFGAMLIAFSASMFSVFVGASLFGSNLVEPFFILGAFMIISGNPSLSQGVWGLFRSKEFLAGSVLLIAFAVIGMVTGDSTTIGNAIATYADFRSIILLFCIYLLTKSYSIDIQDVDRIAIKIFLFLTIFELVFSMIFGGAAIADLGVDTDTHQRMTVLALAPMFLTIRALVSGRVILSYIAFLATIYITVVSVMRLNYIFVAMGAICLVVFSLRFLRDGTTIFKTGLVIIGLVFCVAFIPAMAIRYLEDDPSRKVHGIIRMNEFLEEGMESEETRLGNFYVIVKEPGEFLVPKGIGSRSHTADIMSRFRQNYSVLSSCDSNVFYCVYHFGIFLGGILVILIFAKIAGAVLRALRLSMFSPGALLCFSSAAPFCAMFLLKSWCFMYFSSSLLFGILFFWIFRAKDFNFYYLQKYGLK